MIDEHLLRLCGLGLMHSNYGEKPKFDLENLTTSNEIDFNSLEYGITHFGINFVTIAKRDYGGLLKELKANS